MASMRGIDVRQTYDRLVFRGSLKDTLGAILATGTTTLRLFELQSDGTLKSYDFNDNTFKTTALTTATLAMTHRTGNNSTYNTGIWTVGLTTLTGFTVGNIYFAQVSNSSASPADQEREFQFGSEEGDGGAFQEFTVAASSSTTEVRSNRGEANDFWNGSVIAFTSGTLKGIARQVSDFANSNGAFTVETLPGTPAENDRAIIIGRIN